MSRNTRLSLTHSLNDTHTFKKKYVDLTITKLHVFLKKCGQSSASFILFSSFSQHCDKYSTKFDYKSIDGVLGIRTQDRRIVGGPHSLITAIIHDETFANPVLMIIVRLLCPIIKVTISKLWWLSTPNSCPIWGPIWWSRFFVAQLMAKNSIKNGSGAVDKVVAGFQQVWPYG